MILNVKKLINDIIGIKQKLNSKNLIGKNLKTAGFIDGVSHLKFDKSRNEAKVLNYCSRDDILLELNELLVIEYYSRR